MSAGHHTVVEAICPRDVRGRATALLRSKYAVNESAAFETPVQGSSDFHEAIRQIAAGVVLQGGEA